MRKELSALEALEVTERIQHAWLAGMSHCVDPSEVDALPVFQGGTCLHLVHGSPRFSQDMDFMISSVEGLNAKMERATDLAREMLERAHPGCLDGWQWRLSMRGNGESDLRNPRLYHLTVQAPDWVRSIKIKAEFFLVREQDLARCNADLIFTLPMAMARTTLGQSLQPTQAAMVRALSIADLVADKLYAASGREFSKARDWFDLWWISRHQTKGCVDAMSQWGEDGWATRCSMYQPGDQEANWAMRSLLLQRCEALRTNSAKRDAHVEEMGQWLIAHPVLKSQTRRIVDDAIVLVLAIARKLAGKHPEVQEFQSVVSKQVEVSN